MDKSEKFEAELQKLMNIYDEFLVGETVTEEEKETRRQLTELFLRLDCDLALVRDLASLFLEDYSEKQEQIGRSIEDADYEEIKWAARELQSGVRNFELPSMVCAAAKLEEASKEQDLPSVVDSWVAMNKKLSPLVSVFKKFTEKH